MLSDLTDQELIARAKTCDEAALEWIYEQFSPAIYRYIYYRLGDREAAEDLRADVFMRMLEGLETFEYRGWSISAWLYRIAHDRVIDYRRRQQRRPAVTLDPELISPAAGPEVVSLQRLDHAALYAAIRQLTDEQAEVIVLRFIAGHSLKEAAQIVNRTEGAIKALQHRALQALGRLLGSVVEL